eukprot:TRINITY_DN8102_c0_g1_i1.p1 TRINITY_DN8102_c0_g1~~TRINITY_DN8102_c0_g1_i1.p1  ORF type:complete len:595 (-),score=127.94 TRINITY_DN8102_c0_g1_i1:31-1776(-)
MQATEPKLKSLTVKNFKRFSSLTLPLDSDCLVIMGPNGSGKTQLLYALLLFLRAHNTYLPDSSCQYKKLKLEDGTVRYLELMGEAHRLLHPSFASDQTTFGHFIHALSKGNTAELIGTFDDFSEITSILKANGIFYLCPTPKLPDQIIKAKIQFAYMGTDFHFIAAADEKMPTDPMTSNFAHIRNCYVRLSNEARTEMLLLLQEFFPSIADVRGKIVREDTPSLKIIERVGDNEIELDPEAMGSAFQKVFAALTLFFSLLRERFLSDDTLSDKPEPVSERFFLIEEPESLLYPSLVFQFFLRLRQLCQVNGVKLISVSNSSAVWHQATTRITLSNVSTQIIQSPSQQELEEVFGFPFPLDAGKPILIVEGKHDDKFIPNMIRWSQSITLLRQGTLKTNQSSLTDFFQKRDSRFLFLRDRDFAPRGADLDTNNTIFWALPCIESFFILEHFLRESEASEQRKQNVIKQTKDFLRTTGPLHFFAGYRDYLNKNKNMIADASFYFNAVAELDKPDPDFEIVVFAIHGHTFVNTVMQTDTPELIRRKRLSDFHPRVEGLIKPTLTSLEERFNRILSENPTFILID